MTNEHHMNESESESENENKLHTTNTNVRIDNDDNGNDNDNDDSKILRGRYATTGRRRPSCSRTTHHQLSLSASVPMLVSVQVPLVLLQVLVLLPLLPLLPLLLSFLLSEAPFVECFSSLTGSSSSSRISASIIHNNNHNGININIKNNINLSPGLQVERPYKYQLCLKASKNNNDDDNNNNETKNIKNKKNKIKWIACTSTKEVNRAIQMYLRQGDVVAELGSQLRETSSIICQTISIGNQDKSQSERQDDIRTQLQKRNRNDGRAILVDIERKYPKTKLQRQERTTAMRREGDERGFYPHVAEFVEIQSFDSWRHALFFRSRHHKGDEGANEDEDRGGGGGGSAAIQAQVQVQAQVPQQYNALVVDVSTIAGNDLELTCISLVREFIALNGNDYDLNPNPCRVVIIKSGSLHKLARSLFHAQRLLASTSTSIGGGGGGGRSGGVSLNDNPHPTSIIGTVGVEEYRKMIPLTVRRGDIVLEVGSHFGTTTALLHDAATAAGRDLNVDDYDSGNDDDDDYDNDNDGDGDGNDDIDRNHFDFDLSNGGCIGVDVGPQIIQSAKKKYPHVPFVVGDAWKMSDLIQMKDEMLRDQPATTVATAAEKYKRYGYDVVYVDVGGLSGSEGLLEALSLLGSITNSLSPRCIVIKSLCIRRLASSLVPFSQLWKERRKKEKEKKQQQ